MRYVERRITAEGLGFATSALPNLGKFLDATLGAKDPGCPEGFHPYEPSYPKFLRSLWWIVRNDSLVDSTTLAHAIRIARTLFLGFYKLEVPFTDEQKERKLQEFISAENDVSEFSLPVDNRVTEYAEHALAAALADLTICNTDVRGGLVPLFPKHGPGAVATGEKDEKKWVFTHFYESLHQRYPYYDFMYGLRSNGRCLHLAATAQRYRSMTREQTPTAKLIFVPKDSRGPRIISSEPNELQFMQQAVARKLVSWIEKSPITGGHVNFTDQTVNGKLALDNSFTGEFATLDLSEASDRVSQVLVQRCWPQHQLEDLWALRSYHTLLPSGEKLELKKFAPMGSALCFPVESMIFWALCVGALQVAGLTFVEACSQVYVYGDDIIVPSRHCTRVVRALTDHGLVVNNQKSYWQGHFRESCGVDAWKGKNVTPQRFRKFPGREPSDVTAHYAWLAYASQLKSMGASRSYEWARRLVEDVIGVVPTTTVPTSYMSVVDPTHVPTLNEYRNVRWNADTCYPEARLYAASAPKRALELDSWERLHRSILMDWAERDPSEVAARTAALMSKKYHSLTEFGFIDWVTST